MTVSPTRRRWRSRLANLGLAAVSLGVSVLAAEVVARLVRPQAIEVIAPGLYQPDPPRRYRLSPGYRGELTNFTEFHTPLAISSQGLRGPALPPKSPEEKRLLVLGDSFIFGWGVEEQETLAARLEALLVPEQPSWRVINAGIPGFGVLDEVDWLEAHGFAFEPDAVLLGVFLGNDLLDSTAAYRQVELNDGLIAEAGSRRGLRFQVYRHSHLVRLLKKAVPMGLQLRLRRWLGLPLPWSITSLLDSFEIYSVTPTPLQQEGRQATRRALERLAELTRERGIPLALLLLPDHFEVDPARWAATLGELELDPARYRPDQPARILTDLAAETGIPSLDLSPAFAAEIARGERLYFVDDPHWTAEGHALAAREAHPFVIHTGLGARAGG